jgi:hypothetical protein
MSVIWLSRFLIPADVSKALYDDLKKRVERRIIPELEQAGFQLGPHPFFPKPNRRDRAFNPHGIFRRNRESHADLIEIIYEEWKYPEFHLRLGFAPHKGVRVWSENLNFENIGVSESPVNYSLSSSTRLYRPFAVVWPFAGFKNVPGIVTEAEKVLPQVFDWFDHGIVGPNLFGGPEPAVSEISDDMAE